MADILSNSPRNIVILNGLSCRYCLHNQNNRVEYHVYMNLGTLNFQQRAKSHQINSRIACTNASFKELGARLNRISLINWFEKSKKLVNYKLMVASIEHGLVSQQEGVELIEDESEEQNPSFENLGCFASIGHGLVPQQGGVQLIEGEGEGEEQNPSFQNVGCGSDSGSGSSGYNPLGLKEDEMKYCYLEEMDESVLSKRVLGLSRMNRRKSALRLFMTMEFSGLRPELHACNSLLACLSRSNRLDDMLKVFAIMRRSKIVSGHSCSLVMKMVANNCGSDRALQMFDEWDVESDMKQYFDAIVYNTLISVCGKENKWVQMERIWKVMKENGDIGTAVTYRILVCTFVRCGQYEMAIEAYAEMLQNGLKPGRDEMHAVIGAYSKEEKWDLALSVFQSMLNCGLKPNLIACNALINSLGKAGELKEAFKFYNQLKSLGHTPDSYTWNALLAAFYKANQYAYALQFFDSIEKDSSFEPNLQLYDTALMCCQRLGFWEKALQFLWKMEKSGILVSTSSYNIVIGACEVARKPKIALQVYEHMVHLNCPLDTFTHLSLIRSCIWGDLWEEVEGILDESSSNVSLYNAAIHGMCLRGRIESAKRLYMKMRDIGLVPDGKTRALMLQYMQRINSRSFEKRRLAVPAKRQRRGNRK